MFIGNEFLNLYHNHNSIRPYTLGAFLGDTYSSKGTIRNYQKVKRKRKLAKLSRRKNYKVNKK